jgi:hypothetical protein
MAHAVATKDATGNEECDPNARCGRYIIELTVLTVPGLPDCVTTLGRGARMPNGLRFGVVNLTSLQRRRSPFSS